MRFLLVSTTSVFVMQNKTQKVAVSVLSIELSGLDLPNLTSDIAANLAKGLKRKRPHRSFSVTAFEERLKHDDGEVKVVVI